MPQHLGGVAMFEMVREFILRLIKNIKLGDQYVKIDNVEYPANFYDEIQVGEGDECSVCYIHPAVPPSDTPTFDCAG